MRNIKIIAALAFIATAPEVDAQNVDYTSLENRFVKKELTHQDTVAFLTLGEQKVRQLFDKSNFYSQNYSNTSNQAYVKQQIPDMFYVPPGDSLDVTGLIMAIEQVKLNHDQSIELRTKPAKDYLGVTETLNCSPNFTFYLVLKQVPKKFGSEEELVWQVFLYNPEMQPGKLQKGGKRK